MIGAHTVVVVQLSRSESVGQNSAEITALAARLEAAARGLLTLSTRASIDLPSGLSLTQLRALAAAEQAGACSLGTLADSLMISTSSASRLVDRLVAAGVLDRRTSDLNRREVRLRVTAAGQRLLRRHEAARRAVFADLLRTLTPTETRALLRGLEAVQRYVQRG